MFYFRVQSPHFYRYLTRLFVSEHVFFINSVNTRMTSAVLEDFPLTLQARMLTKDAAVTDEEIGATNATGIPVVPLVPDAMKVAGPVLPTRRVVLEVSATYIRAADTRIGPRTNTAETAFPKKTTLNRLEAPSDFGGSLKAGGTGRPTPPAKTQD